MLYGILYFVSQCRKLAFAMWVIFVNTGTYWFLWNSICSVHYCVYYRVCKTTINSSQENSYFLLPNFSRLNKYGSNLWWQGKWGSGADFPLKYSPALQIVTLILCLLTDTTRYRNRRCNTWDFTLISFLTKIWFAGHGLF